MLHLQQLSWDFEGQRALRHHLHHFEDFEGVSKAKHLCFIEFCRFCFEHFSFHRYLNIEWENCPTGKLRQTAKTAQGKLRKAGLQQPSPPPPPPPPLPLLLLLLLPQREDIRGYKLMMFCTAAGSACRSVSRG